MVAVCDGDVFVPSVAEWKSFLSKHHAVLRGLLGVAYVLAGFHCLLQSMRQP